jgi:hypothetical protein
VHQGGAPTDILNFASDHEMTYPIIPMDAEQGDLIAREFGMAPNIPTTFIYDKTGARRKNQVGPLDDTELHKILDTLLAE